VERHRSGVSVVSTAAAGKQFMDDRAVGTRHTNGGNDTLEETMRIYGMVAAVLGLSLAAAGRLRAELPHQADPADFVAKLRWRLCCSSAVRRRK
jgi:hypothetical protein